MPTPFPYTVWKAGNTLHLELIRRKTMKTKKKILIRTISLVALLSMIVAAFAACKDEGDLIQEVIGGNTEGEGLVVRTQTDCVPLSAKNIQLANGFIYFEGNTKGFFKYDTKTNEVSQVCTDPLCNHMGSRNQSCNIWNYKLNYRVFSNVVVYHALGLIEETKSVRLYAYSPISMKNVMIDENPSTMSNSKIGNRYYYSVNIIVKNENGTDVPYSNLRRVDLLTGEAEIFGNEVEGTTPEYSILGAIDGNIYANNTVSGGLYICSEDDPGNFRKLRDSSIGYTFVSESDIFFKSVDPVSGKEYYYHTDIEGTEISKHELVGGMQWGSIYDGRYLYYIPSEKVTFECGDGSVQPIHSREIFKLDMETGERTVAFTFSGEYETMGLVEGRSLFIVHENKLYTNQIAEYNFKRDEKDTSDLTVYGKGISLNDGLIIIDMENGDITHVTADYERKNGDTVFVSDIVQIEMDLEGEK